MSADKTINVILSDVHKGLKVLMFSDRVRDSVAKRIECLLERRNRQDSRGKITIAVIAVFEPTGPVIKPAVSKARVKLSCLIQ